MDIDNLLGLPRANPDRDRPVLTLVHSSWDADKPGVAVPFLEWHRRRMKCAPGEYLLDACIGGASMLRLGSGLKDKFRPQDMIFLERLIHGSPWGLPIRIPRIIEGLLDPGFVFSKDLARAGGEILPPVVHNTFKRCRQTFDVAGICGKEVIRGNRQRGYYFDFEKCEVFVVHVNQ